MDCFSVIDPSSPIIMVQKAAQDFDSVAALPSPESTDERPVKKPTKTQSTRRFEFIQESKPTRYRDPVIAKQVRSHVRKESIRAAKAASRRQPEQKEKPASRSKNETIGTGRQSKKESAETRWSSSSDSSESPSPPSIDISPTWLFDNPTALVIYKYPIDMTPHMHALLGHYLRYAENRISPLKSIAANPLQQAAWFRHAVTDEAILHSMLYAASVYLALIGGETSDVIYHQNETISVLQKRMTNPSSWLEESTIGAVSCLALGEAISGNVDRWRVHMRAIKQMVQAKGPLSSMSQLLQRKLCRSDVSGAIDYAAIPLLDLEDCPTRHIWDVFPEELLKDIKANTTYHLRKIGINDTLLDSMVEFAYFVQTINLAQLSLSASIDSTTFAEDLYWIEYKLLSFPKTLHDGEEEQPVDKACRLGGLLLMKGIMQEFPHSKKGSSILFSEVQAALNAVPITNAVLPLHLWVSIVGGILSKGDVKDWFTVYLAFISEEFAISSLESDAVLLNRLLGLPNVFGASIHRLWADVLSLQTSTNTIGAYIV